MYMRARCRPVRCGFHICFQVSTRTKCRFRRGIDVKANSRDSLGEKTLILFPHDMFRRRVVLGALTSLP